MSAETITTFAMCDRWFGARRWEGGRKDGDWLVGWRGGGIVFPGVNNEVTFLGRVGAEGMMRFCAS